LIEDNLKQVRKLVELDMDSLSIGKKIKHKMMATATWCTIPGFLCLSKLSSAMWLVGLLLSFLHANLFEFFFHRYYHNPKSWRFQAHAEHHVTQLAPNEAEHVTLFGASPLGILGLFAANSAPWLFTPIWPAVLVGFGIYLMLTEEIHWRAHLGGWIPAAFRKHHLGHHEFPPKNYNVWLPLGDWLFAINMSVEGAETTPAGRPQT